MKAFTIRSSVPSLIFLWLSSLAVAGQPGTVDVSFQPPPDLRNIRSLVVQPDGKIIAGGNFDATRGQAALARLNSDGSLDASFNTGAGANGSVYRVALQPDGRILIGGEFTVYDGHGRGRIARLNADGSADTSFAPGAGVEGTILGIAVQPDGRIVIVGGFSAVDGVARTHVARLNANGSVDLAFVPPPLGDGGGGAPGVVLFDTLALPDNTVLIGGSFAFVGGVEQTGVGRLTADGSRDPAFAPPFFPSSVFALFGQSDGFLLTAGDFWASPGLGVSRLTPMGDLDPNFSSGICCAAEDPMVYDVVAQEDGKILICGRNFHVGEYQPQSGVVRLDAHGNADLSFQSGSSLPAFGDYNTLALQDDGKVLVGGSFIGPDRVPIAGILRLNNDESAGFIKFAAATYAADEISGAAIITVKRSGGVRGPASVHYFTEPGTAQPGRDYQPRSGQLVFPDGESVKTFTIPIRVDGELEVAETVRLLLRQSRGAALGGPSEAVLTITDGP